MPKLYYDLKASHRTDGLFWSGSDGQDGQKHERQEWEFRTCREKRPCVSFTDPIGEAQGLRG